MFLSYRQLQALWWDLFHGCRKYTFWNYLAWSDIRQRYKRSLIGPWWITLSMLISAVVIGVVYSRVLHQDLHSYLPYLVSGLIIWGFISTNITESSDVFRNAANYIKQIKLPFSIYIIRQLLRNIIIFAHNFVVYLAIIIIFGLLPGLNILWIIPGLVLLVLFLLGATLFFALLGTRYRDIAQIINSLTILFFFASPITWQASLLGNNSKILLLNPVYYLLDITRSPLLNQAPQAMSWVVVTLMTIVLWVVSLYLFARCRDRIAFWID